MITAFTCLPSLQAQQFYTAGIPLLEAYLLLMVNNRTRNERPLPTWSRFIRMRVFCGVKKWPTYCVFICCTNRKRSSFATNHFQRKSLKIPPPRSIVCGTYKHIKSEVLSNRHTHTDTQTHRPSTVTLAAHASRGLTRHYTLLTATDTAALCKTPFFLSRSKLIFKVLTST